MPRRARYTVDNGVYHIMIRGNNRNTIFHEDDDFKYFLKLLKENKDKSDIKIYHYILMNNHVHIILKAVTGKSLSETFKRTNISYTLYYRRKYKGVGHFFQDRFKSFLIQDGKYLLECGRYVEMNPVKAGLVKEPGQYKWSSYKVYADGEYDNVVDMNPEYEALSKDKEKRETIYKEYVDDSRLERRNEERFFKAGVYGSKGFIKILNEKGLMTVWSHSGHPKKRSM